MKASWLIAVVLTWSTANAGQEHQPAHDESNERPNIIIIVSDDQGHGDVAHFGGDIRTPNIDRIATEGATWTDWYVAAPVCTPSRFALLTGRHPQRSKYGLASVIMILDESHNAKRIADDEPTFAGALQQAGYQTALVGKWHLGHGGSEAWPTAHGFDSFYGTRGGCIDFFRHGYGDRPDWFRQNQPLDEPGYATDLLTDEAVRIIEERNPDQPLLMVLSYNAPHYGKTRDDEVPEPTGANSETNERTLLTKLHGTYQDDEGGQFRVSNSLQAKTVDMDRLDRIGFTGDNKRRHFAAMVVSMDDGIGRVLDALDRQSIADNTLVIFFADNGADETVSSAGSSGPYRGAKHTLWEGGIRVPCAMRWPNQIAPGTVISAPGSAMDIPATLAAIGGVKAEASAAFLDSFDFSPLFRNDESAQQQTIEQLNHRPLIWVRGNSRAIRLGQWKMVGDQLFNLETDPGEQHAETPEDPHLVAEMMRIRDSRINAYRSRGP